MCSVTLPVEDQPHICQGRPGHHTSRSHIIYLPHSRSDDLLRLSYQTPSIITRAIIGYLSHSDTTFARSLRSLITPFPSIPKFPGHLRSGVRHVAKTFGCTPAVTTETEHIPLAAVTVAPTRVFADIPFNWEKRKADVRCTSWALESTTDINVIFATVRFAVDTTWCPEIAGALSPHTLADLLDCFLDGEIIPGKSDHAISIGVALVLVLSVQLDMEPENDTLQALCRRLHDPDEWELPRSDGELTSTSSMVRAAPSFITTVSFDAPRQFQPRHTDLCRSVPHRLSTTHKLWLTRVVLQTLWRCQRIRKPINWLWICEIGLLFEKLTEDDGQSVGILKANCFLIAAIFLGLQINFHDLYSPNNSCVISHSLCLICSSSISYTLVMAACLF